MNGLSILIDKLVMTKKKKKKNGRLYPLIYKLLTLALNLLVVYATVDTIFFYNVRCKRMDCAAHYRLDDEWWPRCLCWERYIFKVDNESLYKDTKVWNRNE